MSANRISIPDVLARSSDHVLICTFGANFSFYEGPLWRSVVRARNRIVLADDRMLARQLTDQATGGSRLRHINFNYVASPITSPGNAHAKLILLTDALGGTLLVGSGNLGQDGYASRGEIFRKYVVSQDDDSQLAAFRAARDFVDLLGSRGYLDLLTRKHVDQIWADAPWISAAVPAGPAPVRHNLRVPLADQLIDFVDGEPVAELIVHAPFYDPSCEALRRLLVDLAPRQTTVLLQERRTSVDRADLERVLAMTSSPSVRLAEASEAPGTFLHAKFVLVRTETRSITLAGSANLSLAALYRTDQASDGSPAGNIELSNLWAAAPEAFDELLGGVVTRDPAAPISALNVHLAPDDHFADDGRPRLQRGTWMDGALRLEAASALPSGPVTVVVAATDVEADLKVDGLVVTARIHGEAASVLDQQAVPVWLRFETPLGPVETSPVYPYHPGPLAEMLAGRRDPEILQKVGRLDDEADDDELASVVDELDEALVIDSQSLRRLAGRPAPSGATEDDGPHLQWAELDWDRIRRHRRLTQYDKVFGGQPDATGLSDVQIVLASILERFRGIGDREHGPAESAGATRPTFDVDDLTDERPPGPSTPTDATTEELESDVETEQERLRLLARGKARARAAWQRFCDRFSKGIEDSAFVELVGPRVVVTNVVVFNHLLALLVAKDVLDVERGVAAQVALWTFLWGGNGSDGYLMSLDIETRLAAMQVIEDHGGEQLLLSAVSVAAERTRAPGSVELRRALRNVWRHLLESPLLTFTGSVLAKAVNLQVESASEVAERLDELAHEWVLSELYEVIRSKLGVGTLMTWTKAKVHRADQDETVDVLEVERVGVRLEPSTASTALACWAQVDRARTYYRIRDPVSRAVAVWDRIATASWFFDQSNPPETALPEPQIQWPTWAVEGQRLITASLAIDDTAALAAETPAA